jgi:hypothetical protein
MKQCVFLFCLLIGVFSGRCEDFDVDNIKVGCDCNNDKKHSWRMEKIDENWMQKLGILPPQVHFMEQLERFNTKLDDRNSLSK